MSGRLSPLEVKFIAQGVGPVVAAVRSVSKEVEDAARNAEQSGDKWYALGHTIGRSILYAGALVATGFAIILKNTIDAERSTAQLEGRLESLGSQAAVSRQQIDGMTKALVATTTFDDDSINEAATALLKFTNIRADEFGRSLALAADLAVDKNQSIAQSAEQLGTALNDPIKGLRSLRDEGIALAPTQVQLVKDLVAAGRASEAQALLLQALEDRYGTAAEAARGTFGGAVTALIAQLGELTEGEDGSLDGTRLAVESLTQTLSDPRVKEGFDIIVSGALNSIGALSEFALAANDAYAAAQRFATLRTGGTQNDTDVEQIKYERKQLEKERSDRAAGLKNDFISRVQRISSVPLNMVGMSIPEGMSDVDLNNRLAALKQKEAINELIFGKGDFDNVVQGRGGTRQSPPPSSKKPEKGGGKQALTDEQRAAVALSREYANLTGQLNERIDLFGKEGDVAKWRYDLESGSLAALSEPQKQALKALIDRVEWLQKDRDALEQSIKAEEEATRASDERARAFKGVVEQIADERAALTLTADEYERYSALRSAGVDAMSGEGRQISAYIDELQRLRDTRAVFDEIGGSLTDLAVDAITNFDRAGDAGDQFAERMKQMAIRLLAQKAIQYLIGAFLGGGTSTSPDGSTYSNAGFSDGGFSGLAKGGVATPGGLQAFANGGAFTNGLYDSPTMFRFANGGKFGVMGEAGPEAVMPLTRGADGKLGVAAHGGGNTTIQLSTTVVLEGGQRDQDPGQRDRMARRMQEEMRAAAVRVVQEELRDGGTIRRSIKSGGAQ